MAALTKYVQFCFTNRNNLNLPKILGKYELQVLVKNSEFFMSTVNNAKNAVICSDRNFFAFLSILTSMAQVSNHNFCEIIMKVGVVVF